MRSVRVQTPSRLHFGLLGWGPEQPRQFGGVGLMVDDPGLDVEASPADRWKAEGPLAGRAQEVARRIAHRLAENGLSLPPLSLAIHKAPPEHVGLGTGTQLSLAIARAALELAGSDPPRTGELAAWTGRGRRSGIGLHGFESGGMIVDGGRGPSGHPPPRIARLELPQDWNILMVIPRLPAGLHGRDEVEAFRNLRPPAASLIDRLCGTILLRLLPAAAEGDLPTFGAALTEIQRHVGRCFAPAQGGEPFAHSSLRRIAERLAEAGFHGVGQSSWGPTIYAFSDTAIHQFEAFLADIRDEYHLHGPNRLFWTRPNNTGAIITES